MTKEDYKKELVEMLKHQTTDEPIDVDIEYVIGARNGIIGVAFSKTGEAVDETFTIKEFGDFLNECLNESFDEAEEIKEA